MASIVFGEEKRNFFDDIIDIVKENAEYKKTFAFIARHTEPISHEPDPHRTTDEIFQRIRKH